jgi:hypothetical protein
MLAQQKLTISRACAVAEFLRKALSLKMGSCHAAKVLHQMAFMCNNLNEFYSM